MIKPLLSLNLISMSMSQAPTLFYVGVFLCIPQGLCIYFRWPWITSYPFHPEDTYSSFKISSDSMSGSFLSAPQNRVKTFPCPKHPTLLYTSICYFLQSLAFSLMHISLKFNFHETEVVSAMRFANCMSFSTMLWSLLYIQQQTQLLEHSGCCRKVSCQWMDTWR